LKPQTELQIIKEKIRLREAEIRLKEGLPHLHGWKWYKWARVFFESTNPINLLCAANQISKSSTQIRKCIDWATDIQKWPRLWPDYRKPEQIQLWYLYPSREQATIEFAMKWMQFMPSGEFKDHPQYGWKEEKSREGIVAIHFNSGAHVFFKTYSQKAEHLQTGSCHAIFCDEELPTEHYDELIFRISATNGYFHMVFTATLGQDFWRKCMDPKNDNEECLKGALKQTVSMYDSMEYEDGSPSPWTLEKIKVIENRCKTHAEVLKRVHGKFILDTGLKYPTFDLKRHLRPDYTIPATWHVYGGVDIGSGGEGGHPSAIVFVAVKPDYKQGRVFFGWRGDGVQTTAGDVVNKFLEMKKTNPTGKPLAPYGQYYDWGCKDFETIATRMGEPFLKAEKSHEKGEGLINVLFKNDMMCIHDTFELNKLATEIASLRVGEAKRKSADDFCDALRYAITLIPWDLSAITADSAPTNPEDCIAEEVTEKSLEIAARRGTPEGFNEEEIQSCDQEIEEWNSYYEQ
jgi:phage terminase large subunit-like protein